MRFLLTLLGGVSLTFLVLVGGAYAFPEMLDEMGINPVEVSALYKKIDDLKERSEELNVKFQEVVDRSEAKDNIVKDLIAGKLTLPEAAARFRDLPGMDELCWENSLSHGPGSTLDEKLCWYTIGWARDWLTRTTDVRPAQHAAILNSLEATLFQHLEQYGTVDLPGKKA